MRTNLPFIQQRIGQNLAESGQEILLTWKEWPAGSVADPVNGGFTGTPTTHTAVAKAFVHFIPPAANSQVRLFNEFEDGDAILDFAPDVAIDNKVEISFTISGEVWVPKKIGDKLARSWDVQMRGEKLYRSVLVRKAT
jgi:hypothetical protein